MFFLEHTIGLCKSYEDKHSALRDKLRETSLRCKCFFLSRLLPRERQKVLMISAVFCECWQSGAIYFALYWISVGRLEAVSWRVDYTLSSSELREVNEPMIQLKLQAQGAESGSTETTVVSVSADKLRVLLAGQYCILQSHIYFRFQTSFSSRNYTVLNLFLCSFSAELKQAQAMMNAL